MPELEEAVSSYIALAAKKLRAQDALAGALQIYIRTNIFKPEVLQYQPAMTEPLAEASSDIKTAVAKSNLCATQTGTTGTTTQQWFAMRPEFSNSTTH